MAQLSSTLTASAARANFYQILANAVDNLSQYTIKIRGKGDAVIMSAEELDSWRETLEIMSDPQMVKDIRQGIKELKAGKGIPYSKVKKQLGW